MSTLHETTRRRLCRAAFLLLGAGPTFALILWAIWIDSAAHRRAHETSLAALLDMQVSLGRVSTPRPGVTLYQDVQLLDPETRAPLGRLASLEVDAAAAPCVLIAAQPELHAERLARVWQTLERALRRAPLPDGGLLLAEADVTLRYADGHDQTLANFRGRLAPAKVGASAAFAFRVAGCEMPRDATLRIERHPPLRGAAPVLRLDFDSGDAALPVHLLAPAWPALRQLGDAVFRGQFWVAPGLSDADGAVRGRFDQVDLQTLVGDQFPATVSGIASVDLETAEFSSGRLTLAKGALLAGGGRIWNRTLEAAQTHLDCSLANPRKKLGVSLPYQELAAGFHIDGARCELTGKCQQSPGTLIVAADEPLLQQPQSPQNTIGLIRLLVPESDVQIPAVSATAGLLRLLPLPDPRVDPSTARNVRAHSIRPKSRK